MAETILLRGDTKVNWENANPIIPNQELVVETDTGSMKYGDGVKRYKELKNYGGNGTIPAIGQYYLCGIVFYIDYQNKYIYVAALDKIQNLQMAPDEITLLIQTNSNDDGFENTKIYTNRNNGDLINKYPVFYFLKNLWVNGFSGWFLPTLTNSDYRKAFNSVLGAGNYWTSFISQQDGNNAYSLIVTNESQEGVYEPGESISSHRVVPVKKIKFS